MIKPINTNPQPWTDRFLSKITTAAGRDLSYFNHPYGTQIMTLQLPSIFQSSLIGVLFVALSSQQISFGQSQPPSIGKGPAAMMQIQESQKTDPPSFQFKNVGKVKSDKLKEISGVCHSFYSPNEIWVHNDSGGKPRVYLLSEKGKKLLEVTLTGVKNKDWEDLCCFRHDGKPYLLIADVGDNATKRKSVFLHIIEEPNRKSASGKKISVKPVSTIEFTYQDAPRNCESVAVSGNQILLFSKGAAREGKRQPKVCTVYTLPLDLKKSSIKSEAKILGTIPSPYFATAADISIDGNRLIVRDYARWFYYSKKPAETWKDRLKKKPDQQKFGLHGRQNEAIGFDSEGTGLWTISEGKNPKIWRSRLKK